MTPLELQLIKSNGIVNKQLQSHYGEPIEPETVVANPDALDRRLCRIGIDPRNVRTVIWKTHDKGTIDDRLNKALENDQRLKELWEWAKNDGKPRTVGFPGDRSRAECALAAKLGYWFQNDKTAVRKALNRANPPKWSEERSGYKDSVLTAAYIPADTYDPHDPKQSDPSRELAYVCYWELLGDCLSTATLSDRLNFSKRQTRKALRRLEELGFVRYDRDGRRGYWIGLDIPDANLNVIEDEFRSRDTRDEYLKNQNIEKHGRDSRTE